MEWKPVACDLQSRPHTLAAGAWALSGEPHRFLAVLVIAVLIAIPVAVISSTSLPF